MMQTNEQIFVNLFKKLFSVDNIAVLLLSVVLFFVIVFYLGGQERDVTMHAYHVKRINMGEANYPPAFLLYFVINIFSFFSTSSIGLSFATIIVLSFSIVFKYILTKNIIRSYTTISAPNFERLNSLIPFVAFCLLFIFAIPDYYTAFVLKKYYLGRVVPNVWHNSTIIFLMPFALLLFWQQYKILISNSNHNQKKQIIVLTILVIINLFIKPSFFFVYAPITILFLLFKFKFSRSFFVYSIPIVIGCVILITQYVLIYIFQYGYLQEGESHVEISKPFELWANYIPMRYIPLSLLISFILPILYYIFYINDLMGLKTLDAYAILLTLLGLLISIFFIEEGPRRPHGNFFWQNVVCSYIMSLVIVLQMIKKINIIKTINWKLKTLFVIFLLQFLSGIFYIGRFFYTNSYY